MIVSLPTQVKVKTTSPPSSSDLAKLAATMKAGEWKELVTQNMFQTLGQVSGATKIITPYSDIMVWDPVGEQAFFIGADHLAPEGPQIANYTAKDNTWRRLPRPAWLATATFYHGYEHTALDPTRRILYHRPYNTNTTKRYDIATQVWTDMPALSNPCGGCYDALEFFPDMDGVIWVRTTGEIYLFKESVGKWTLLKTVTNFRGGTWTIAEYNPRKHVIVFSSGNSKTLFTLDKDGNITQKNNVPIAIYEGSGYVGVFTTDPISGAQLALTGLVHSFYKYDLEADKWEPNPSINKPDLDSKSVLAVPIKEYGVVFFTSCLYSSGCAVYLYKHSP